MKKNVAYILILLLLCANIFFIVKYSNLQKENYQVKAYSELQCNKINEDVLEFTKIFVEKVLKAGVKIDINTKLELDAMIKKINNKEISAQWQKIIESKTKDKAQQNVRELLELLVNKIENS